jgi:hypothetical protein
LLSYPGKKGEGCTAVAYCVPDITMLKLNVVMLPALAEAVNVKVAETELPTAKTELSRFQVTVKYVLAFEGTQLVVVMLSVMGIVPVFLT